VTGPASFLGDPELKTLEMYVEQVNAEGGVLGRPLELVSYDAQHDAKKAVTFVKRLIEQDKVDLIVGGSTTGTTMAVVKLIEEAGVGHLFDQAMQRSAALFDALNPDYPEQAPYAVSMAYRLRYMMQFNAREAIHMLELRSSPQGHPSYRRVALEMHRLIADRAGHHAVAAAMSHMTTEAPELERLESERRAEARRDSS